MSRNRSRRRVLTYSALATVTLVAVATAVGAGTGRFEPSARASVVGGVGEIRAEPVGALPVASAPLRSSPGASDSSNGAAAPSWSVLYARYMGPLTVGDCGSCHAEATSAAKAYDWLASQQYMAGRTPYLVDARASCLSWLGGDMPPDGPSKYARATRDLIAWANAGASKN
jgi:hypothetical protein